MKITEPHWLLGMNQSIPGRLGASLVSAMQSTGELIVRLDSNLRGRQELGYYLHRFPPQRLDHLTALVEQIDLWNIPEEKWRPGVPSVGFIREERDVRVAYKSWALSRMPPSVEPLVSLFNHLADEARQSPVEVLAGEAGWVHAAVRPKQPLELTIRLYNPGSKPIVIQSPRTPVEDSDSSLQLLLSRIDAPPDPENPDAGFSRVEVPATSVARVGDDGPQIPTHVERIELAPGEEVRFTATQGLYLAPGRYRAVLLFASDSPEPAGPRDLEARKRLRRWPRRDMMRPSPTAGQLAMELPDLTVERPARG